MTQGVVCQTVSQTGKGADTGCKRAESRPNRKAEDPFKALPKSKTGKAPVVQRFLRNSDGNPLLRRGNVAVRSEESKVSVQICLSHAAPVLAAELTMPVTRTLPELGPEPVSPVMPALAATRVRLATVAARYSWNSVLARPK